MTLERLFNSFIPPKKLLYLQNKFLATPLTKGVATGVDIGIHTPPKSAQVKFLWGKNDVRTAI